MNHKKRLLYTLCGLCCLLASINGYTQAYDVCGTDCNTGADIDAVLNGNLTDCAHPQWFALYTSTGTFVAANMTGDFPNQPTRNYTLYGINYELGGTDADDILDAIQAMNGRDINDLLTGGALETADCFDLIQRSASVNRDASCGCPLCPTVDMNVNYAENLCDSGTPDYAAAAATIQVSDDTFVNDTTFWLDNANPPTMPAGALTYGDGGTNNNCDPDTVIVYAYVECDEEPDGTTDSFIAAGSFVVLIYPDISNQANVVMDDNTCCPSFTLDANCATNYTVTNTLDGNGDTPDCTNVTTNGMVTFTVALNSPPAGLAAACTSVDYMATYRCAPCPSATTPVDWQEDFCVSGDPDYAAAAATIVVDDPDNLLADISFWLDNANPPTMAAPTTLTYPGDGCATEIIIIYAFLECDEDGDGTTDSYIDAGSFEVNLYPDIANQNNTINMDGGCCPSLSLECATGYTVMNDLDTNGASPDCSNTFDAGNITFTITNDNAPNTVGTCWQHTMDASYDCLECPTVTSDIDWSEAFCANGTIDEAGAIGTVNFNDPSGLASGVSLWLDNGAIPTLPIVAAVSYDGDGCATDSRTIYAFVECDEDGDGATDTYLPAGSFQVDLYPDLADISILNEGGCCPSLDFDCTTGYTITNSFDDNGATPTCDLGAGVMNFTITNDNAPFGLGTCKETILIANYDCRACPTITTAVNWSEAFCVAGNPDYVGAAATISISDPSNVNEGITFWLDAAGTMPAPNFIDYQGTGCSADVTTIYALVGCDRDQDGTVEQQVEAGSFDLTIYPEVRQPVINRTAINNGMCTYEVIPGCPDDVLDGTTFGPLPAVTNAGTTSITATSGITGTLCTDATTFEVPYEACSNCPFEAALTIESSASGVTPFSTNTATIEVTGALLPLRYNWSRSGFVRYRATSDESVPSATISIFYSNGATWAVTITDAAGCEVIRSNNQGNNEILDIDNYVIQPASSTFAADGAIDISVSGGTPPYSYQWFGPRGFADNIEDVNNLRYGWHRVIVTDSSVPQQSVIGYYYVSFGTRFNTGFIRGKAEDIGSPIGFLGATPNPFTNQTTVAFAVNQAVDQATVNVYTLNGQKVVDLYAGALEVGEYYTVDFISDGLAAGIYILQLTTDTGIQEQFKLVVVE